MSPPEPIPSSLPLNPSAARFLPLVMCHPLVTPRSRLSLSFSPSLWPLGPTCHPSPSVFFFSPPPPGRWPAPPFPPPSRLFPSLPRVVATFSFLSRNSRAHLLPKSRVEPSHIPSIPAATAVAHVFSSEKFLWPRSPSAPINTLLSPSPSAPPLLPSYPHSGASHYRRTGARATPPLLARHWPPPVLAEHRARYPRVPLSLLSLLYPSSVTATHRSAGEHVDPSATLAGLATSVAELMW